MRFPTNICNTFMKYVKRHAVPQPRKAGDVVVTDDSCGDMMMFVRNPVGSRPRRARSVTISLFAVMAFGVPIGVVASVLPEARLDRMYHYYSGDDVTVHGPAALTRVNASDNVSVAARYYLDVISSASPDVISSASKYSDMREEFGLGVDILNGNSLVQLSMSTSKENDYQAETFGINTAHDFFNGLTTVSFGFSQGQDLVKRVDTSFEADINRYHYRLGLTQVLTRSLLFGIGYEGIADEGYLNNPYRSVRILGATRPEIYPNTRDSQAVSLRIVQGFPSPTRAIGSSLRAEYRYFRDNWEIRSHTLSFAYQKYFGTQWLGELRHRYYQQSAASFYSDDFPMEMTYMARDKELSTFQSHSLGVKGTWYFMTKKFLFLERASLNFSHDYIYFDYDNYTNVLTGSLHSFGAHVVQLFISAWY